MCNLNSAFSNGIAMSDNFVIFISIAKRWDINKNIDRVNYHANNQHYCLARVFKYSVSRRFEFSVSRLFEYSVSRLFKYSIWYDSCFTRIAREYADSVTELDMVELETTYLDSAWLEFSEGNFEKKNSKKKNFLAIFLKKKTKYLRWTFQPQCPFSYLRHCLHRYVTV